MGGAPAAAGFGAAAATILLLFKVRVIALPVLIISTSPLSGSILTNSKGSSRSPGARLKYFVTALGSLAVAGMENNTRVVLPILRKPLKYTLGTSTGFSSGGAMIGGGLR